MVEGKQEDMNAEVSIPDHQKLLPLAYPSNPERASKQDLAKHAFASTKQEIIVGSETPEKNLAVQISPEESKGQRVTLTRHDSMASIDSLESNPAKFSDDEDLDPFKLATNGMT